MEDRLPIRQKTFLSALASPPDEIIPGRLYLGGINAALNAKKMSVIGITHILSVCPDCTWDIPTRIVIPVDDALDVNILILLREACEFIQQAIDSGGKIYVHCVMGISRSVTVVCAYLMKTQKISAAEALTYVKSIREVAKPNDGFLEQLEVWQACDCAPSVNHPAYIAWERKHYKTYGQFLRSRSEPIRLRDRLYITEDLPSTAQSLASLLRRYNVTHLLTMSPYQPIAMSESTPFVDRCHLSLEDTLPVDFVLGLPEVVEFIDRGLKQSADSIVLIHSFDLTRICVAVSAHWMAVGNLDTASIFCLLEVGLPRYRPTEEYIALMAVFEACDRAPVPTHPEIIAFRERFKGKEAR